VRGWSVGGGIVRGPRAYRFRYMLPRHGIVICSTGRVPPGEVQFVVVIDLDMTQEVELLRRKRVVTSAFLHA